MELQWVFLVRKVIFEIPDDLLISVESSDNFSIKKKKKTDNNINNHNQTKSNPRQPTKQTNKPKMYSFYGFGNEGTYLTTMHKYPHLKIQVIA